jgi:hypothetical protein
MKALWMFVFLRLIMDECLKPLINFVTMVYVEDIGLGCYIRMEGRIKKPFLKS